MVQTRKRNYEAISQSNEEIVWKKGYKGFKFNFSNSYSNYKINYKVGETYHHDIEKNPLELCESGFHFCLTLPQVINYYNICNNDKYRYCEIEYDSREGHVIHEEEDKSVTSSIRILRELSEEEINKLLKGYYEVWRNETTKEFHREGDLPAYIEYYPNQNDPSKLGSIRYQQWWINGLLHRDGDLPAKIHYYENKNDPSKLGPIMCQKWFQNGNWYREEDLPASITYYKNKNDPSKLGPISSQYWYQNGKCHREGDLPAVICYYENENDSSKLGPIEYQSWYQNGEWHREGDLPAFIIYYLNKNDPLKLGSIYYQEWFQNGKCIKGIIYKEND